MRKFTPEEKWAIVQEGRQGPRNVSRVCKKHGISRETFYTWEEQIKQAALAALTNEIPGRKPANQPTTMSEARALLNVFSTLKTENVSWNYSMSGSNSGSTKCPKMSCEQYLTRLAKRRYTVEEKRWLLTQAPGKHDPLPIADYLDMLGVSEASFYHWQARPDKLENASSRPKQSPKALPVEEVAQVLVAALKHPNWGGGKISDYLATNGITYVSAPPANRIKKRLKAALGGRMPKFSRRYEFLKPNDAWATDIFHFTWEGHKLYLLIVQDDHSRSILNWTITTNTSTRIVQQLLIQTFARYGLPALLKTDNGPEFRKQLREFLQGYRVHHYPSPPYRPSFNGKVERKYRDI